MGKQQLFINFLDIEFQLLLNKCSWNNFHPITFKFNASPLCFVPRKCPQKCKVASVCKIYNEEGIPYNYFDMNFLYSINDNFASILN